MHETVFQKVIQRAYLNFRLFCNTFECHLVGDSLDAKTENLRAKLDNFYMKYLLIISLHNADILDAIQCLQYKAVPHATFFRIVNFINMLTSIKNLRIKKCIFLFNQEVVYSSINPMDLFIINEYMTEYLFPKFFQLRNNQSYDIDQNAGCFVTDENERESLANAPKIYLYGNGRRGGEFETYRMAIYNIMDVSLVMLVEDVEDALGDEFSNEIKSSIGAQIGMISKEISDNFQHFKHTVTKDDGMQEKYIFFNHRNYRFHACLFSDDNENTLSNRDGKGHNNLSTPIMNLLCDLYAQEEDDNVSMINTERESIIKTYTDHWIVRRYYNYRSFYLILHKNSTLIDIAEDSQRLLDQIVKNVYITNLQ